MLNKEGEKLSQQSKAVLNKFISAVTIHSWLTVFTSVIKGGVSLQRFLVAVSTDLTVK